jgi:hypothetical protein
MWKILLLILSSFRNSSWCPSLDQDNLARGKLSIRLPVPQRSTILVSSYPAIWTGDDAKTPIGHYSAMDFSLISPQLYQGRGFVCSHTWMCCSHLENWHHLPREHWCCDCVPGIPETTKVQMLWLIQTTWCFLVHIWFSNFMFVSTGYIHRHNCICKAMCHSSTPLVLEVYVHRYGLHSQTQLSS